MNHFQWAECGVWHQKGIMSRLESLCVCGIFIENWICLYECVLFMSLHLSAIFFVKFEQFNQKTKLCVACVCTVYGYVSLARRERWHCNQMSSSRQNQTGQAATPLLIRLIRFLPLIIIIIIIKQHFRWHKLLY